MRSLSLCVLASAILLRAAPLRSQEQVTDPVSPAARIAFIKELAGAWRFAVYHTGNPKAVATGRRDMRLMADSLKLVWTETFDTTPNDGSGILGYDAAKGTYFVVGAYANTQAPFLLVGQVDSAGHSVTFRPIPNTPSLGSAEGELIDSELHLVDAQHFEWTAYDGRWRVVFTRA
jgi:hypothetical protein